MKLLFKEESCWFGLRHAFRQFQIVADIPKGISNNLVSLFRATPAILVSTALSVILTGCISIKEHPQIKGVAASNSSAHSAHSANLNIDVFGSKELIVALIGLIVGLFLSEASKTIRSALYKRSIKSALLSELKQLRTECDRIISGASRDIQLGVLGASEPLASPEVFSPIFSNFYKDVVLHLNVNQRISYQLIQSSLSSLNKSFVEEASLIHQIHEADSAKDHVKVGILINNRAELASAMYGNARTMQWHIDFHMHYSDNPQLTAGNETHRQYLIFLEKIELEIKDIREKARGLSVESFSKRYDAESFDAYFKQS